jgi:hypothetical protein
MTAPRPLLFDCWAVANGRRTLAEAVAGMRTTNRLAGPIADRAIAAFNSD